MSFIPLLEDAAMAATGSQSMLMTVLPFVLIIAIFYFFIIRPQNKKQKEAEQMRNAISKGDKVVTIGGIHGTVSSVKERTVIIKVEDGARIEFDRSAIASVISDKKASVKSDKDKKEEKIEQAKAEEKSEEKIEEKSEPASESTTEENASSAESAPAEKTE
ncbi:MAG: preprotein translocase subunit YajC [Treponema sp.]|nr:preprotein translocase subunit YajC [Treponema sp.]MBR4629048.1 preprotein translocase subunit YajC [Treponema sp.]MBR6912707.1 preprotein translocase subunit YajC [Treponema sp.]MCR5124866.1 preprotein translocase subunit YajC [Treponema sp.]